MIFQKFQPPINKGERSHYESSIVYEVIRSISSLFIYLFFYEKILRAQKHVTSKNWLTKQKQASIKQ